MVGLAEDRGLPVDPRARVDQVDWVELSAAVVALVAARGLEPAVRARALDVAVGQRVAGGRRERDLHRLFDDEALVVKRAENVTDDPVMVLGRGPCEQVIRETEVAEVLANDAAVLVGGDHDRRPVFVRSTDHEDLIAAQTVVAGENVRRYPEPRQMADVAWTVRIRPRWGDENPLGSRHRELRRRKVPAQSSYEWGSRLPAVRAGGRQHRAARAARRRRGPTRVARPSF